MHSYSLFVKALLLFFSLPLNGNTLTPEEKCFVTNHYPPDKIVKKLDAVFSHLPHELRMILAGEAQQKSKTDLIKLFKKEGFTIHGLWFTQVANNSLNRKRRVTLTHESIPNYFLKIGFDKERPFLALARVFVADLVNESIKKYQLSLFGRMEKKIYHRPQMPVTLNDFNYVVLSPFIHGHTLKNQEHAEFYKILVTSHEFYTLKSIFNKRLDLRGNPIIVLDFHKLNFITNDDKTFFLIDTEPIFEITTPPFSQNFSAMKNRILNTTTLPQIDDGKKLLRKFDDW